MRFFLGSVLWSTRRPFSDHTLAMVLYVVIGAGGLVATLLTRFESDLEPATRAATMRSPA